MLSFHELEQYKELGYVGPFNIFDAKETNLITQKLRLEKTKLSYIWLFSSCQGLFLAVFSIFNPRKGTETFIKDLVG